MSHYLNSLYLQRSMNTKLKIYNTLTRKSEEFEPITKGYVGMYVCGPTVYSNAHLGNARTYVSFDVIYRYLLHLGYKVRYVRNITDAGHLEGDQDEGDDKFAKRAKLEQLEPMEIVQRYTVDFHKVLSEFNTLAPSIEPTATGHIIEQIEMTQKIIDNGFAYHIDGTVYFDVEKFSQAHNYTILSNRNLDELLNNTRSLGGQDEKKGRLDFALWIKAKPEHLMKWPSPWGIGFPGWHIECSAMSTKYLGPEFDIHGGGMDLIPTHHTNEIAQNIACSHAQPAKIWMHTNMLTVNGQKMSKSLGNSFLPHELFSGEHPLLTKGFSPMTVRFFMLQAHYRSTLDFSNEALQAAEKGLSRMFQASEKLPKLKASNKSSFSVEEFAENLYAAMNEDFNTPIVIAHLFEGVRLINLLEDGKETLNELDKSAFEKTFNAFLFNILGLKPENTSSTAKIEDLMHLVLQIRNEAKLRKDYTSSDQIRDRLKSIGIEIKDGKEGTSFQVVGNN